jgi:hypothetical protein
MGWIRVLKKSKSRETAGADASCVGAERADCAAAKLASTTMKTGAICSNKFLALMIPPGIWLCVLLF